MGGRAELLFVPFRATDLLRPSSWVPCLHSQRGCLSTPSSGLESLASLISGTDRSLPSSPGLLGRGGLGPAHFLERLSEPCPFAHATAKSLGLEEYLWFARWKPLGNAREGLPPRP